MCQPSQHVALRRPHEALLLRDLRLAFAPAAASALSLAFFLIVTVSSPSGGPESEILSRIGPGSSGSRRCSPRSCRSTASSARPRGWGAPPHRHLALPLEAVALAKASRTGYTGLPLTLAAAPLGVLLNLRAGHRLARPDPRAGHARAVGHRHLRRGADRGLRRGGLLLSLLVLPLYVPTLIFGAEAARRGAEGSRHDAAPHAGRHHAGLARPAALRRRGGAARQPALIGH
jgi:heme exporter protein B